MLDPDNLIRCYALSLQLSLEPLKRRRDHRVLIAQPLDELYGKSRGQRAALELPQNRRRRTHGTVRQIQ